MIVKLLVIILSSYAGIYLMISIIIALGEMRLKPRVLPSLYPFVSVVVCARNEEENMERCCESLLRLDYPRDKLEIILVDDESEDNTMRIMRVYMARDSAFRVLSTDGEPHDLPGKQRPLNFGIRESKGDIILVTDADTAVKPGWIKAHLTAYDDHIGIAGASTRIDRSSGKLFDGLQCCDLITKHAVAMGWAGLGLPLTVMGNNMSFRRDAYDVIGGLRGINVSVVEDMALMNAIVKRTKYTCSWVASNDGVVIAAPEPNFTSFINQHLRWMYELSDLSLIGKFMISVEAIMLCSFIISIGIVLWNPLPFTLIVFAWLAGYTILLAPSPQKEKGDIWFIPGMIVFQMIYSAVILWKKVQSNRNIIWRGRVFESEKPQS